MIRETEVRQLEYWFVVQSLICMFEILELDGWKVFRADELGSFYIAHPDGRALKGPDVGKVHRLLDGMRTFCPVAVEAWRDTENLDDYGAVCEAYDQYNT